VDFAQCCHVERSETSLIIFCEIVALQKQPEILRFAQNDTREANAKSGLKRLKAACISHWAEATVLMKLPGATALAHHKRRRVFRSHRMS